MASHPHQLALPRQLNQRTVAIFGLDFDPFAIELRAMCAAGCFQLNHQLAAVQKNFFGVPCMPRIKKERCTQCQQLQPGERHHQRGALKPEENGHQQ